MRIVVKETSSVDETPAQRRKRAVAEYVHARDLKDRADELVKKAEAEVMAILDEEELKSGSVTENGVTYTVSVASPRTTVGYDEDGLKKALGAKQYAKLTTSKLDKTKLEEAVKNNEVDVQVVAQHSTITHGSRSVRLTRKVAEPSDPPTA